MRNDYIMRMIEMVINIILYALKLKKDGNYIVAMNFVEETMKQHTGLDFNFIDNFDTNELVNLLKINGTLDLKKALILSVLLKERADILSLTGYETDKKIFYEKSFHILKELKIAKFDFTDRELIDFETELTNKISTLNN
jgi:hypothetical protein